MKIRSALAAAAFATAAIAASGCGSSGGKPATPTTSPAPTSTAASSTPKPSVEINGSNYRFVAKGYAIDVPQGWTMKPDYFNDVAGGRFPTDVIFPAEATGEVSTSVSVECLKSVPGQASTDAFRDAQAAFLAQIGTSVSAPRAERIGDRNGFAIDYVQEVARASGAIQLEKTDAGVMIGACRWLISLTAPAGQRASRGPAFGAMLRSMTFFPAG